MTDQSNGLQSEPVHVQRWNTTKVTINGIVMTNEALQQARKEILDNIDSLVKSLILNDLLCDGDAYEFKKTARDIYTLKNVEKNNGGLNTPQQTNLTAIEATPVGKLFNQWAASHYAVSNPIIAPPAPVAKPFDIKKFLRGSASATALLGINIGLPIYLAVKLAPPFLKPLKNPLTNWKHTAAISLAAIFAVGAGTYTGVPHFQNRNLDTLLHYGATGLGADVIVQASYDGTRNSKGDKDYMGFWESMFRRLAHKGTDVTAATASIAADSAVVAGKVAATAAVTTAEVTVDVATALRNGLSTLADENDPDRLAIQPTQDPSTIAARKKQNAAATAGKTVTVCFNRADTLELKQGQWSQRKDFNQADASAYYKAIDQQAEILKADKSGALYRALNGSSDITVVSEGYRHNAEIKIIPGNTCPSEDYLLARTYAAPAWIKSFGFEPK